MLSEATRFKLAIGLLVAYLIEGVIKSFVTAFPFTEVAAGQAFIAAYYFTVRTVQDVKQAKLDAVNGKAKSDGI